MGNESEDSTSESSDLEESDFYQRYDPCGLPTHTLIPFDSSKPKVFWIMFGIQGFYIYHMCLTVTMGTAMLLVLLEQLAVQLKNCGLKFASIDYTSNHAKEQLSNCILYHQDIFIYAECIFKVFRPILTAFMSVTSFAIAVIGYQVAGSESSILDKVRYILLLMSWTSLMFIICFQAQKIENECFTIGDMVYNSAWTNDKVDIALKRDIIVVLAMAQRPMKFKINFFGSASFSQFVAAMKTAYSCFTLLQVVTEN